MNMLGLIILTFLGGVLLSGLIGLVVWVSVINKNQTNTSVKTKKTNDELFNSVSILREEVSRLKLDVHKYVDDIYRDTDARFSEVDRVMDSRLDKLENRLTKINDDGCETAKSIKQQLNG